MTMTTTAANRRCEGSRSDGHDTWDCGSAAPFSIDGKPLCCYCACIAFGRLDRASRDAESVFTQRWTERQRAHVQLLSQGFRFSDLTTSPPHDLPRRQDGDAQEATDGNAGQT